MDEIVDADELLAQRSVLMETAEVPLAVAGVAEHCVEEHVQVVDRGAPVDQTLDGRGRFMRDDQIDPSVMLLKISPDLSDDAMRLLRAKIKQLFRTTENTMN